MIFTLDYHQVYMKRSLVSSVDLQCNKKHKKMLLINESKN